MHACYEYGSIFCRLDTHASVKQIRRISPIWLVGRKFEIHNSIDIWIVQYKSIHFTNADSFTRLFTAINSDFHSDKNLITLQIAIITVFKVLINSHCLKKKETSTSKSTRKHASNNTDTKTNSFYGT